MRRFRCERRGQGGDAAEGAGPLVAAVERMEQAVAGVSERAPHAVGFDGTAETLAKKERGGGRDQRICGRQRALQYPGLRGLDTADFAAPGRVFRGGIHSTTSATSLRKNVG